LGFLMIVEATAINDSPDIITTEVMVGEGGDIVITPSMLAATDIDNVPEELIFTITQLSLYGSLFLNGVVLDIDDQFSMQHVINGELRYFHDGSITETDYFDVSLVDGNASDSSSATVNIVIEPLIEPALIATDSPATDIPSRPEQLEEIETIEIPTGAEVFDGNDLPSNTGSSNTGQSVSNLDVAIPISAVSPINEVDFLYGDELHRLEVKQHNKIHTVNYEADPNALTSGTIEISLETDYNNARRTIDNANFQRGLANLSNDLEAADDDANKKYGIQSELGLGVSVSVTAGILAWVLRGGSLLASALAATPLWGQLDPVKVITSGNKDEEQAQHEDNVEEIFRNSN